MFEAERKTSPFSSSEVPFDEILTSDSTELAVLKKQVPIHPAVFEWAAPAFLFLMGCAFSVFPIVNAVHCAQDNKDYSHWHTIGRSVLAGAPLYEDLRNGEPEYMYPPTAAVLVYGPLSVLSPVLFVAVLCFITSMSWGLAVWAASKLVRGNRPRSRFAYAILPGLAIAPYVWDVQLLGQTNLLLLALTLLAFVAMRSQRVFASSALFGAAVAMKAFPISALAYFVVRRQWSIVCGSVLSIFALIWFFPGVVRGFERNTAELAQWTSLMIFDQSGETMAGRTSIGFTRRNQSIVSCTHRLLRPVDAGDNPKQPLFVNIADVSPGTAHLIGHGICFLLGLILLVSCRFRFGASPECEGLEVAMVCTLVPLCSPLSWTYFFCWLLPAWTALLFWIDNPTLTPQVRRMAKFGVICASILLASAVSEQFDPTLQACGVTAFGSVALFLTLALIRLHFPVRKREESQILRQWDLNSMNGHREFEFEGTSI